MKEDNKHLPTLSVQCQKKNRIIVRRINVQYILSTNTSISIFWKHRSHRFNYKKIFNLECINRRLSISCYEPRLPMKGATEPFLLYPPITLHRSRYSMVNMSSILTMLDGEHVEYARKHLYKYARCVYLGVSCSI